MQVGGAGCEVELRDVLVQRKIEKEDDEGRTKRALERHWTTSSGRFVEVDMFTSPACMLMLV